MGKKLGDDITVNVKNENLQAVVRRETGMRGADPVLETSGNLDAVNQCVLITCCGATAAFIGFCAKGVDAFNIDVQVSKRIRITGMMGDYGTPAQVIRIFNEDQTDLSPIVSHAITMDELPKALLHPKELVKVAQDYDD